MSDPQQSGYSSDPSWQAQPAPQPPAQPVYQEPTYQPAPSDQGYQASYPDSAPPQGYPAEQAYPTQAYPTSADPYGQPQAAGYPPPGYPVIVAAPPVNGLSIAALVVSIVGVLGLCGYGLGGYIGIVGAILGHVSRKQIRERGEGGAGLATAGIIVGWIAAAIAVLATIAIVGLIVWAAQQPSDFESGY
ncbi:DUF4190 domain-containing protein [Plantactinospora soyae]|uniref:DUF4190 domain-containing protein n=1 Tax=Plantactinospora soyae TaxID=1544732 RepID=A0A927QXL0_9ACTN|nr:DUF4190 domain-containing protein [Plantactinospora soyae]MBE1486842.1 hypothetical protein [Plantactinospora soyae]